MPKVATAIPDTIRPLTFHGLSLDWEGKDQATGDCPFCGKDQKLSVSIDTGLWRCFVCGQQGNLFSFIRQLWTESDKRTNGASKTFAEERGLLWADTLTSWGVVQSSVTREWLVPGYSAEGQVCNLYKRIFVRSENRWELRPTPTLAHQLHGVNLYDARKSVVHLHESWGNALAFWEVARMAKRTDLGLEQTANPDASILGDANVLAVANCGAVGEALSRFAALFADKTVVLWFDSDHPREHEGRTTEGAGFATTKRAADILSRADKPPKEVRWMRWGEHGFDPDEPTGHDVRDELVGTAQERIDRLGALLKEVATVPDDWIGKVKGEARRKVVEPLDCQSWAQVLQSLRAAMRSRRDLEDVLAVMLALGVSTNMTGDQLFLMLIGDPGSGKSTLCDALTVSRHTHALEHLTGFHSGSVDGTGDDFSLLARANHKLWITSEADVMVSSPIFFQLMAQIRRIFDGRSAATYKNMKEDRLYDGLRTPWIMGGTPKMLLETEQSSLGDRFLKIWIDKPEPSERREILRRVGYNALEAVTQTSNCDPSSTMESRMLAFHRTVGGYLNHLVDNAGKLIGNTQGDWEWVEDQSATLAEFAADLRARGSRDPRKQDEPTDSKELPSRLHHQFCRLARCLGAVLGHDVDERVMRLVKKVALDTSRGKTREVARLLRTASHDVGKFLPTIASELNQPEEKMRDTLRFMRTIGSVETFSVSQPGVTPMERWRLTPRLQQLWDEVCG